MTDESAAGESRGLTSIDTAVWLDPACAWTWALVQSWELHTAGPAPDSVPAGAGTGAGSGAGAGDEQEDRRKTR